MEFYHVTEICGRERGGRGVKGHGEAGCCWALSLAEDAQLHFAHFIAAYATNVRSLRNVLELHMCIYICNYFCRITADFIILYVIKYFTKSMNSCLGRR